jgi:signal transduction histidine kinase
MVHSMQSVTFEPIISACESLDAFGLPRAVGNLQTDRFVIANRSFLQVVGLTKDEIPFVALSEVVKIHFTSTGKVKIGRLVPIVVRTLREGVTIGGHAAISKQLAFFMIPLFVDARPDFEVGAAVGEELQRQKVAAYVHDHLTPELLAAIFSIESVRVHLEKEHHPCAERLKEIEQELSGPIRQMRETLERSEPSSVQRDLEVRWVRCPSLEAPIL